MHWQRVLKCKHNCFIKQMLYYRVSQIWWLVHDSLVASHTNNQLDSITHLGDWRVWLNAYWCRLMFVVICTCMEMSPPFHCFWYLVSFLPPPGSMLSASQCMAFIMALLRAKFLMVLAIFISASFIVLPTSSSSCAYRLEGSVVPCGSNPPSHEHRGST